MKLLNKFLNRQSGRPNKLCRNTALGGFLSMTFWFISFVVSAQPIELTLQTPARFDITAQIGIYEDKTSQLSFETVKKTPFTPFQKSALYVPFSSSAHWYKITLRNKTSNEQTRVVKWNSTLTERVDFYIPDQTNSYKIEEGGSFIPSNQLVYTAEEPYAAVKIAPHEEETIFIRIQSQRGHFTSLTLYTTESLADTQLSEFKRIGFVNGIMIIRLFYVLLLVFFVVRDVTFRQYSIFLTFRTIAFWGIISVLGKTITQNGEAATIINFMSYHIMPICYILVLRVVFPIKQLPAFIPTFFNVIIVLVVLLGIGIIVDYHWYWLKAGTFLVVFFWFFIILLFVAAIIRKLKIDWSYSIPFILSISGYIFIQLSTLTGINIPWKYEFANFSYVAEIFVFGLFLGKIIRNHETARLSSEKQLSFTQEQAERLQELDQLKTNFFTGISHEFRTPLTLLIGPLDDLQKKFPKESILPIMQRNAQRLLTLINQLLDLGKLDARQMQVNLQQGDLAKFLQMLSSSFQSLAESRNITFALHQSHSQVLADFDADKIEKIIINLLSNAFKFTENGGHIKMLVEYSPLTPNGGTILFSPIGTVRRAGGGAVITLKDSGIGISPEKLTKIFDRFYQIDDADKRTHEGTGIGLALVKELVDLMKGDIRVESQLGAGTTFYVTLPLTSEARVGADQFGDDKLLVQTPVIELSAEHLGDSPLTFAPQTSENILLIVEDNDDLRAYIRTVFEDAYQVVEAADGQEGLEKALEFVPDIVISDLMMPRMDGFEFCKCLKSNEKTSHIPVVMLTAKATLEDRIEGFELGADDYLVKPFNTAEIKARVRNLVLSREQLKQRFSQPFVETRPEDTPSIDELFIEKVREQIEKRISDSRYSIDELATEMNMSPSQLLRKLKALTNFTTVEFIREYRLQKAAWLLSQKSGSVSDIAYQTGFESLSYFTKAFQKKYNILPSEY